MKIALFGPQGVGKGTIGSMISEKYNIPLISMGQIFRDSKGTEMGDKIQEIISKGDLVPDELTVQMLKERLAQDDCANGYILDGFPRTLEQADLFGMDVDFKIVLEAPEELLIKRLTGRRTCKSCGAVFNIFPECSPNPQEEGVCDKCGGELYAREDDNEEAIKKRLETYKTQTSAVFGKYPAIPVDSSDNPDAIFERVVAVIEK